MSETVNYLEHLLNPSPLKVATREAINTFMWDLIEEENVMESATMLPSANKLTPDQLLLVVMYGEQQPSDKDVTWVQTRITNELKKHRIDAEVHPEFTRDTAKYEGEPTCWATFFLVTPQKQRHLSLVAA